MNVISSSYGNDSVAMIQWAHEQGLSDVHVVFIDTGWSATGWMSRVSHMEQWVKSLGFNAVRLTPTVQFEELMRSKKGFPSQRYQWCSVHLKGVPFLGWIDEADKECKATVLIGKRRDESPERADTAEFIASSEYHGGRRVWHPLFLHTDADRDALLKRAGFDPLPHRSRECSPCINSNRADLRLLDATDIAKVEALESDVGKTMFRPARHNGAVGVRKVIAWASASPGTYNEAQDDMFSECSSGYCGH
jgi:hypothetical protein